MTKDFCNFCQKPAEFNFNPPATWVTFRRLSVQVRTSFLLHNGEKGPGAAGIDVVGFHMCRRCRREVLVRLMKKLDL